MEELVNYRIVAVVSALVAAAGSGSCTTSPESSVITNTRIVSDLTVDGSRGVSIQTLEITTDDMEKVQAIANQVVGRERRPTTKVIRMFFYYPGETPKEILPRFRAVWWPDRAALEYHDFAKDREIAGLRRR
jgi:hypothetical protein